MAAEWTNPERAICCGCHRIEEGEPCAWCLGYQEARDQAARYCDGGQAHYARLALKVKDAGKEELAEFLEAQADCFDGAASAIRAMLPERF